MRPPAIAKTTVAPGAEMPYGLDATMSPKHRASSHVANAQVGFETGRSAHYEGPAAGSAMRLRAARRALAYARGGNTQHAMYQANPL